MVNYIVLFIMKLTNKLICGSIADLIYVGNTGQSRGKYVSHVTRAPGARKIACNGQAKRFNLSDDIRLPRQVLIINHVTCTDAELSTNILLSTLINRYIVSQ